MKETNYKLYLKTLYSTIILKDILIRHRPKYTKTFKDLANYTISNFALEISYNRLKNIFDFGSSHTAKNYLGHLEESYLVFNIEKFSYKRKESLTGPRKVYAIDTGMIRAVGFRFSEDISHLYENVVALELRRKKAIEPEMEIYYWKNTQQEEVDFVIKRGLKIEQLIQVCYIFEDYKTRKRELRAITKASKELECTNLLIITEDYDNKEIINGKKIKFLPLWKWLIS